MTELCTKELYDVVVAEAPMPHPKCHHYFSGLVLGMLYIHTITLTLTLTLTLIGSRHAPHT